MEFDVFDKLSELETKLHFSREELKKKDGEIAFLRQENHNLKARLASLESDRPPGVLVDVQETPQTENEQTADSVAKERNMFSTTSGMSVADQLKEASESVTRSTGYIFDQTTGLYYDNTSGYYYDPENQLFFDPRRGVYYSYNSETGEYTYHSRAKAEELAKMIEDNNIKAGFLSAVSNGSDESRRRRRDEPHRERIRYSRSRSRSSSASSDRRRRRRRRRHRRSSSRDSSRSSSGRRHRSSRKRHRRRRSHSSASEKSPAPCVVSSSAVRYPPCVRLVVLSSRCYRPGKLSIVRSKDAIERWATLGRCNSLCPVLHFPHDSELDDMHCELLFKPEGETYAVKDKRSKSGTFVNGQRLERNQKFVLTHGDILRLGSNRVLVHIHEGTESCEQCVGDPTADEPLPPEPEALAVDQSAEQAADTQTINEADASKLAKSLSLAYREERESTRRAQMNALKDKYGLRSEDVSSRTEQLVRGENNQYKDRAATRRMGKASTEPENPDLPRPLPPLSLVERTNRASVDKPIAAENKGAQLLSKMGWKPGSGLGKSASGIAVPIRVEARSNQFAGLGSGKPLKANANPAQPNNKIRISAITADRYNRASTDQAQE